MAERITVTRVELTEHTYKDEKTKKKILTLDNNQQITITEKNKVFSYVTFPGIYDITRNSYGAIATVRLVERKGDAPMPAEATAAAPAPKATATVIPARQPSEFDIMRQKEIALEFYVGIAKDILISGKDEFTSEELFNLATDLYKKHRYFLYPAEKVLDAIPGSTVVDASAINPQNAPTIDEPPF